MTINQKLATQGSKDDFLPFPESLLIGQTKDIGEDGRPWAFFQRLLNGISVRLCHLRAMLKSHFFIHVIPAMMLFFSELDHNDHLNNEENHDKKESEVDDSDGRNNDEIHDPRVRKLGMV